MELAGATSHILIIWYPRTRHRDVTHWQGKTHFEKRLPIIPRIDFCSFEADHFLHSVHEVLSALFASS